MTTLSKLGCRSAKNVISETIVSLFNIEIEDGPSIFARIVVLSIRIKASCADPVVYPIVSLILSSNESAFSVAISSGVKDEGKLATEFDLGIVGLLLFLLGDCRKTTAKAKDKTATTKITESIFVGVLHFFTNLFTLFLNI